MIRRMFKLWSLSQPGKVYIYDVPNKNLNGKTIHVFGTQFWRFRGSGVPLAVEGAVRRKAL